jgi:hypothetical protein
MLIYTAGTAPGLLRACGATDNVQHSTAGGQATPLAVGQCSLFEMVPAKRLRCSLRVNPAEMLWIGAGAVSGGAHAARAAGSCQA